MLAISITFLKKKGKVILDDQILLVILFILM